MRFNISNMLGPKGKIAFFVVSLLLAGVLIYENIALKGRQTFTERVSMAGVQLVSLPIEEVGVEHTIEISSGKDLALRYSLDDPQGASVYSHTEVARHTGARSFTFTPQAAGKYALRIEPGMMISVGEGHGSVRMILEDRRIITPLFRLLKF